MGVAFWSALIALLSASDTERFRALLKTHCTSHHKVSIRQSAQSGRYLAANTNLKKGEEILGIPQECLITAHRSGRIRGLIAQTDLTLEHVGDLRDEVGEFMFKKGATWDVRLAVAVMEATVGCAGPFWDEYRRFLPLPQYMNHPLCLPMATWAEFQDDVLMRSIEKRLGLLNRGW